MQKNRLKKSKTIRELKAYLVNIMGMASQNTKGQLKTRLTKVPDKANPAKVIPRPVTLPNLLSVTTSFARRISCQHLYHCRDAKDNYLPLVLHRETKVAIPSVIFQVSNGVGALLSKAKSTQPKLKLKLPPPASCYMV